MQTGPRNLITDVAGLTVGHAKDNALKTGATVLTGDRPFVASAMVMGGAPGTRETDLLAPDKTVQEVDAIVLSGGSAFGLDACSGVAARLLAAGRGFPAGPGRVPIVPGAIIFDLYQGQQRAWTTNPYAGLGAAAFDAASADFALGTAGAGTGALTAMLKGGLGSASLRLEGGATVGALAVANPVGCVTTPGRRHFWAAPFEANGEFGGLGPDPRSGLGWPVESLKQGLVRGARNTIIAIVATDAALDKAQCHRMATAAHDGIARACVPSHTPADGDIVFAVSAGSAAAEPTLLGHAAALCLSRALTRAIYEARPETGDLLPTWRSLNG